MTRFCLALPCLAALACTPDFDDRPYLVERARLIAVVAEPAEARPTDRISLSPVVAGRGAGELSFRFCARTRPLADPRPIAEACLDDSGSPLEARGHGAHGAVPADACARFGPDPVGNNLRPADADASGGFYQPVVVDGLGQPSVALVRIHCPLPDAPAELLQELEQHYRLNLNPELEALQTDASGALTSEFTLRAGVSTRLRVTWPATTREDYVWLPPDGLAIEPRRETLRVSWFASSGTFASSATGGDVDDDSTFSVNLFTADEAATHVDLWAVLQDSRGGSTAKHWQLRVEP